MVGRWEGSGVHVKLWGEEVYTRVHGEDPGSGVDGGGSGDMTSREPRLGCYI